MDRKSITAVIRWGNGSTTEVCKAIIGSNRCARRTRCASETKRNNAVSVDAPWSPRPSRAGVRNVRHRSSLATFRSGPFKRFGAEPLHTLSTVKRPSDRMPRTAALAGSSSSSMLCRCSRQRRRRKRSAYGRHPVEGLHCFRPQYARYEQDHGASWAGPSLHFSPPDEAKHAIRPPGLRCACLPCSTYCSSAPARAKRRAPRPDAPLTHFASPRGEKYRLVPVDFVPDRNTVLDGTTRPRQVL